MTDAVEPVDQFPTLGPDLLRAIGSVAVNASRLERVTAVVMWGCYPVDQEELRRLPRTVMPDDFTGVTDDLKRIAERLSPPDDRALIEWVARARRTMKDRHKVVHGTWSGPANEQGKYRCDSLQRIKGSPNSLIWIAAPADVLKVARDLRLRETELQPLLRAIVRDIPYASDTIVIDGPPPAWRYAGRPE